MGQVCYRRDVNQTIKTTQKFHPMKRSDALNLFISQQVQSVKSVKGIENEYQKIKDSSDPNMILQHQLYQAKEQNNIQFILEHMTDDTSINNFQDFDHAWAEKPKSIGSVAMMFMGFMIMRELSPEELGYQYQEQVIDNNIRAIVQFGIFGKLKNNLKHRVSFKFQSLDRVQITVLFLVFFIEFQEFHQLLLDENFFQVIIPYVYINTKYPMGFRIAAGFILRDLFKNRRDLIKILLQDLNYTNSIKNFLKNSSQQFVFEGLNTLEDLIYDSESSNFTHVETCKTLNNLEFFENLQYIQLQLMYPQNNSDSFQENDSINEERQVILEIVKHLMIQILQHNI